MDTPITLAFQRCPNERVSKSESGGQRQCNLWTHYFAVGTHHRIRCCKLQTDNPFQDVFLQAAREPEYALCADFNGRDQEGLGGGKQGRLCEWSHAIE